MNTTQSQNRTAQNHLNVYIRYIQSNELRHLFTPSPYLASDVFPIAENIRKFGLLEPIRVFYNSDDGKYYIISGERRYTALTLLGRTRILCHIITDPQTRDAIIIAEHCLKENANHFRSSDVLQFMINNYGYSVYDISKASGISINRINKLINLSKLSHEEKRRLNAKHIPEDICCEIAELDAPDVRKAVIDHLISTMPNVKKLAKEKSKGKKAFSLKSDLIDNSISRLKKLIENTGATANLERRKADNKITYTLTVGK